MGEVNAKFKSLIVNPVRFRKSQLTTVMPGKSGFSPDVQLSESGLVGNTPKSNVNGSAEIWNESSAASGAHDRISEQG